MRAPALTVPVPTAAARRWREPLLVCGVVSPLLYVGTDLLAGARYPGYSFTAQAVSELFAIGAPTSGLVVARFTAASALLLAFGLGVGPAAGPRPVRRALGLLIVANAVNGLVLWNCFPMHMRGVPPTFTDTMHGLLAINPFVLATLGVGVAAFRGWFRWYSVGTIVLLVALAAVSLSAIPAFLANQPTPWMGLTERGSQYAHQLWHAVLAGALLRDEQGGER